jgi:hypothetical protein
MVAFPIRQFVKTFQTGAATSYVPIKEASKINQLECATLCHNPGSYRFHDKNVMVWKKN